ncbi:MAG: polysaccharide deacetylase family protein [Candidatus Humimicrobiaceae bacterium]
MEKYIIFGFDMETDIGSYLKTYNGVKYGTGRILSILKKYSINATFLWTGDAALNNSEMVTEVSREGFETGCHSLKHETVGDAGFNMPNDSPILETELEARLIENIRIVKELSGNQPVSFRAPRLWQGHGQIKVLEKLGFKTDASYSVAAHKKQIIPYHPSEDNWLEKGSMNILEIPNFAFLDDKNDYSQFFCKNDQWPLLRLLGAEFVFKNQKYVLEKQNEFSDICVLLFYLHPWEFEKMPEKFEYDEGTFIFKPELSKNCGDFTVRALDDYIDMCLSDGFEFKSCKEFYEIWREHEK